MSPNLDVSKNRSVGLRLWAVGVQRTEAIREGFLEEGTWTGYINPRVPPGRAPPSAGQEARMWLISAWGAMFL